MPTTATKVVSGRPIRTTIRTKGGTTMNPIPTNATRNKIRRATVTVINDADTLAPDASVVRIASSTTAVRSSASRMPNTSSRRRSETGVSS